jgi:signal transduction histidine kinase
MEKNIDVLVLDDEPYVLKLVDREFRNAPFSFAATVNREEAMSILSVHQVKVVVCDQRMPKTTGIEFLQGVKEKYPNMIRILFSGYVDLQVTEDAVNIGQIYRYVNKPWEPGSLLPVISQSIARYDLVTENRRIFDSIQKKNRELEVLNQRLEGMVEFQKEFTSIVSHELRTPLASIKSTLDLVLEETPGKLNKDQKSFLVKSKDNVNRLNRLVRDILDLSKLDFDQMQLKKIFCDVKELINNVVGDHISAAKKKNLALESKVAGDLPSLFIDEDKIYRALSNLVNNAIKFTDQGIITVSGVFRREKNSVEICVRDTGSGIEKEDMEKLFQKFQQFGEGQKRVGGTGLGLVICQEIIHHHGGEIWAESEYGKGSRFYFTLPVKK